MRAIELSLDVTNRAKVLEVLERNEVDFVLVSALPEHFMVEKFDLMENKMYLVGKPNPIFENQTFEKDILSKLPLVYREEGSFTRITMEKLY